jgi:hypothetical protein
VASLRGSTGSAIGVVDGGSTGSAIGVVDGGSIVVVDRSTNTTASTMPTRA